MTEPSSNSDIELRAKYSKIFDNGVAHIDAAILLASAKRYDFAVSHIILGIEELIKYQVVYYHFSDSLVLNKKELEDVFSKHGKKHKLLDEFNESISGAYGEHVFNSLAREIFGKELDTVKKNVDPNRFASTGFFLSLAYKDINLSPDEKKAFSLWIKSANDKKNNGLYVNYKNGNWIFPHDITETEYLLALRFAMAIKSQTEVIKSLDITDDELWGFLSTDLPTGLLINGKSEP